MARHPKENSSKKLPPDSSVHATKCRRCSRQMGPTSCTTIILVGCSHAHLTSAQDFGLAQWLCSLRCLVVTTGRSCVLPWVSKPEALVVWIRTMLVGPGMCPTLTGLAKVRLTLSTH